MIWPIKRDGSKSMSTNFKPVNKKYCLAIVVVTLFEVFFFRNMLGNDALFGDVGDGRLCNLLAEHWYRFFLGKEGFADLGIFYPAQGILGYTDCLLGFGVPHSLLRMLGVDTYSANKIVIICFHIFGSVTLLHFLYKNLKLKVISSLVGVAVFSLSNSYQMLSNHTQLYAISLIPGFFIVIFKFFENIEIPKKRRLYGIASVLYFEYMLYTSYYPVFFLVLFLLVFCLAAVIVFGQKRVHLPYLTLKFINRNWVEIFGYIVLGSITAIPFFQIYLPVMRTFGGRSWNEVASALPTLTGLINVSNTSLLYGNLFKESAPSETTCGFPLITFAVLITAEIYLCNRYIREKGIDKSGNPPQDHQKGLYLYTSLAIAVGFIFLLLLKVGDKSLWYLVYRFVPGAGPIRAVSRYLHFLCLPVGILIAKFYDDISSKASRNDIYSIIAVLSLAILILDNTSKYFPLGWDRSSREEFISSIPQPPEECTVFYLRPDGKGNLPWVYQLDAWEIANQFDLKTINGYSGQYPIGWQCFDVNAEEYAYNVDLWCTENNVGDVYSYDEASQIWSVHKVGEYLNRRTYSHGSEKIFFINAEETEAGLVIYPDGYTYGPYIQMEEGEWTATIYGENLDNAEIKMHYEQGNMPIECDVTYQSNDKIELEFAASEDIADYEVLIKNSDDAEEIIFDHLEIAKNLQ